MQQDGGGSIGRYMLITLLAVIGLGAEAGGVGLLFAWLGTPDRTLQDPRLAAGLLLAVVGFVAVLYGLRVVLKKVMMVLRPPHY